MSKVVVSGSRDWEDEQRVRDELDFYINKEKDEILVGDQRGVDRMTKNWAYENGIKYHTYEAEWNKYGKKAGPIRNQRMVNDGDKLIAFSLIHSKGTKDTIKKAENKGMLVTSIMDNGFSITYKPNPFLIEMFRND